MFNLQQGFSGNHAYSSDPFNRINGSYDSFKATNFGMKHRRTAQNYGDPGGFGGGGGGGGGGGIEFGAQIHVQDDETGVTSPPLWKTSPPTSPRRENSQFQRQHYHYLSPASRTQAIARGRMEMMEMVQNMPESHYELSLKDLVEHPMGQGIKQETLVEEKPLTGDSKMRRGKEKKIRKKNGQGKMLRSGSMDNGAFLLKMFFPTSLGSKKKSSTTGTCAKVSPKPQYLEGPEKGVDKEWWKKRFSVTGENESGGMNSFASGSIGSSRSSGSRRSRHSGGCLPGFWSFFHDKKSKTMGQKEDLC